MKRTIHVSVENVSDAEQRRWLQEMVKVNAADVLVGMPVTPGKLGRVGFSVNSDNHRGLSALTEMLMIQRELLTGIYEREALVAGTDPKWAAPQLDDILTEQQSRAKNLGLQDARPNKWFRLGDWIGRFIVSTLLCVGLITVVRLIFEICRGVLS